MKIKHLLTLLLASASFTKSLAQDAPPKPVYPIPSQAQIDWQRLETYAFIHFGLNTYNDLEWGYGDTPATTFAPAKLDVDQWVRTLKRAGMRGIILTAKHHDGFCLWPTKTTDYSVKNSPWKDGKGDLVAELSAACRRAGLQFGIYVSPWDRHHPEYGSEGYQRAYHEQIRELSTNYGPLFEFWFDGANGGTGWYGGANEARSIDPQTYYQYDVAARIIREHSPKAMIFGGTEATIRWIGNERGYAGETNWAMYDESKEKHYTDAQWGMADGSKWLPGEVDVSIRPGWFYHHREDHQVRSVANLVNLYYQSVGHNANLLLNFPVALDGRIPAVDSARVVAWHDYIQQAFRTNLLRGAKVSASPQRQGRTFSPSHLTDGKNATYWAAPDGTETAEITFSFARPTEINNVALQEHIALGQRVERFALEVADDAGRFVPVATQDTLTTIGYKRLVRFPLVRTKALRVRVLASRGPVCLNSVAAYRVEELLEPPTVRRDSRDQVTISTIVPGATLEYALLPARGDASRLDWKRYTAPFAYPGDHVELLARVSSAGAKDKPETRYQAGYSLAEVMTPGITDEERLNLFDENGSTAVVLSRGVRSLALDLPSARPLHKLVYTPVQARDATGHIQRYELYVDGKLVRSGELSNIKNNPIPVSIDFPAGTRGQFIRLVVTKVVDDASHVVLGDLRIE